jgi:type VII secretion-associated protein (TIGR03931 family)
VRLAVRVGGPRLRLARVGERLGQPRALPAPPVSLSVSAAVRAALGRAVPDELVVVYPSHWPAARVRAEVGPLTSLARLVLTCPVALAMAREVDTRSRRPPGPLAVLEIGPAGSGVTVLADLMTAAVLAGRFSTAAQHPAELLAGAASAAGLVPAELTGGVLLAHSGPAGSSGAVAPLLEELVNLAGQRPVLVPEPDEFAALGALRPPRRLASTGPLPRRTSRPRAVLGAGLLADPPPPRRLRAALVGLAAPLLVALVTLLGTHPPAAVRGWVPRLADDPVLQAERNGVLSQYDYALVLPVGWRQSGGLPTRRRTLLTLVATPNGSDLISVEQTPLGYDSSAERDRAFREFEVRFAESKAAGAELDQFTLSTRIGDRDVIAYRQHQSLRNADVDWYVLFERDSELSVGCQHTEAGTEAVRAACAEVVASLRLRGR